MKRKLFFSSAVISAMMACGATAQVVNFHDAYNSFPLNIDTASYNELFAGQGAYADAGNDIWNGFGYSPGYGSTYFYSGVPGSGPPWPQQFGNPGNPYAAYYGNPGWVSSTGSSLFNVNSGSPTASGNATSSGQWTPITLSVAGYQADAEITPSLVPNGAPVFLFSSAAYVVKNASFSNEVFTLQNVPSGTYGLYLYGASPGNNGGTAFSLNSGSAHNGIAATLNSGVSGAPAQSFVEGQNYVIFENVTPNAGGDIIITASPNPQNGVGNSDQAGYAYLNGIQLIFNPPPTAVASTAAQNVYAGGAANFSFSPAFAASPAFQWQSIIGGTTNDLSDGGSISGSATAHLKLANVSAADAGLYQCVISTASATNTSPAAPLTILTSAATNILQPGDTLSDFNNDTNPPYNSIPPPFNMGSMSVEDGTLNQYENFGANGSTAPFMGPVGFIVTPQSGATYVNAMRIFASGSHPEDDPADYLLEGSTNGTDFTPIAGGLLDLPAARNAAGGAINVNNQVLQELDFTNTAAYTTYRLTFTNVNNNAIASNGVQIAEIQLLGVGAFGPPVLSIALGAPGNVVVSWPAFVTNTAALQQTTALNGTWTNVNATPVVVKFQNQVTLTNDASAEFYRLSVP